MKKIRSHIPYFLFAFLFVFSSCSEDDELNTNITPVDNFFTPEDNLFVKLQPASNASVTFEWEQARAEDGTLVLYEVAFDKEGGDFSAPIYTMTSNRNGVENRLSISHGDLNRIANLAGIPSLETGKLKWTVIASKGINTVPASMSRTLEVERPAGFATVPADLYLTGSATEAGADVSQAIQFKQTASGIFELYTSLKPGTYSLIDRKSGEATSYFVDGQLIREGEEAESPAAETEVYRIRLDFNNAAASFTEITAVELWFPPLGEFLFELPYAGNGTWEIQDAPIVFKQESWGRDERYKFRFTVEDSNGETGYEWFGSTNADNQRPTAATSAAYWHMIPVSDDDWAHTFKFNSDVDNNTTDIQVIFNNTVPAYTHSVTPN